MARTKVPKTRAPPHVRPKKSLPPPPRERLATTGGEQECVAPAAVAPPACVDTSSEDKARVERVLSTALVAFNNHCAVIGAFAKDACVARALFGHVATIRALFPCLCNSHQNCAHGALGGDDHASGAASASLLHASSAMTMDLLFFIFEPRVLASNLTWQILQRESCFAALRVLLSLDLRRVRAHFCRTEFAPTGTYKAPMRLRTTSKYTSAFGDALVYLYEQPTQRTFTVANTIETILASMDSTAPRHVMRREHSALAHRLFTLLVDGVRLSAPLGDPLLSTRTVTLARRFATHAEKLGLQCGWLRCVQARDKYAQIGDREDPDTTLSPTTSSSSSSGDATVDAPLDERDSRVAPAHKRQRLEFFDDASLPPLFSYTF